MTRSGVKPKSAHGPTPQLYIALVLFQVHHRLRVVLTFRRPNDGHFLELLGASASASPSGEGWRRHLLPMKRVAPSATREKMNAEGDSRDWSMAASSRRTVACCEGPSLLTLVQA